mgnify:FL=1
MQKKGIAVIIVLILGMVLASSLYAVGPWQDGTYTAEADEVDRGWKNTVRIEVLNGYIVDAHFDALSEEGEKPKYLASVQGDYGMVAQSNAQARWYVQADRAIAALLEHQDLEFVTRQSSRTDALSGVSITIMPHFELVAEALEGAER